MRKFSVSMTLIPLLIILVLLSCEKNTEEIIIPTEGLVLYMPFDGNTNDLSQNTNNGIDYTSHNYVSGIKSQALDFNGITDYIKLTDPVDSGNGLSFSFWINSRGANGTQNNGAIICKYNMTNDKRSFMVYSFGAYETRNQNRLMAVFYPYSDTPYISDLIKSYYDTEEINELTYPSLWTFFNPKKLTLNVWTHCVINVTSTTIETWINGELCVFKIREYNPYNNSPLEPVYIGNNVASGQGTNNHFNGILDELRIYNRGLTSEEIRALYKANKP